MTLIHTVLMMNPIQHNESYKYNISEYLNMRLLRCGQEFTCKHGDLNTWSVHYIFQCTTGWIKCINPQKLKL